MDSTAMSYAEKCALEDVLYLSDEKYKAEIDQSIRGLQLSSAELEELAKSSEMDQRWSDVNDDDLLVEMSADERIAALREMCSDYMAAIDKLETTDIRKGMRIAFEFLSESLWEGSKEINDSPITTSEDT